MKQAFIIAAVFLAVFISVSSFIIYQSDDVPQDEGFLYSAIGCTSVFKKLNRQDKVDVMYNFIHAFSENQGIEETQPGYLTRFIKIVEKKWEKENEVAKRNCDGIYAMAVKEPKPMQYNAVAQSVIDYIHDLEKNEKETATERTMRILEEQKKEREAQQ